jgi:hypothetical protein
MTARLTLVLIAFAILASGCNTVQAGGEFAFPVWRPQIEDATFGVSGARAASVSVNWRTGQAPFTVDIEMPGDFAQIAPITTSERTITRDNLNFLVPEGTSGLHTYTVKFRIIDALGQTNEMNVDADFNFPAMP